MSRARSPRQHSMSPRPGVACITPSSMKRTRMLPCDPGTPSRRSESPQRQAVRQTRGPLTSCQTSMWGPRTRTPVPQIIFFPGWVVPPKLISAHIPLASHALRGLAEPRRQWNRAAGETEGRSRRVVRLVYNNVEILEIAHLSTRTFWTTVVSEIG